MFKGKDETVQPHGDRPLLTAFLELFEAQGDFPILYEGPMPKGVRRIKRLTPDAFEVEFKDRIDPSLLQKAIKGDYAILEEERVGGASRKFPPRIVLKGEIVAYVTRKHRGITALLYPPPCQWTTYRRVLAALRGVRDLSDAFRANLGIIEILEAYRFLRYGAHGPP